MDSVSPTFIWPCMATQNLPSKSHFHQIWIPNRMAPLLKPCDQPTILLTFIHEQTHHHAHLFTLHNHLRHPGSLAPRTGFSHSVRQPIDRSLCSCIPRLSSLDICLQSLQIQNHRVVQGRSKDRVCCQSIEQVRSALVMGSFWPKPPEPSGEGRLRKACNGDLCCGFQGDVCKTF